MKDKTTIERAFEIARSGEVRSMEHLRRRLRDEGWDDFAAHASGSPSLSRQLIALMRAQG